MSDSSTVVDPEALRAKYLEERDKRLASGSGKIAELVGDLSKYLDDPYTEPIARPSVNDEMDVVIVGAGLGGLMIAAGLAKAGLERIRLIDSAGDVGGVWYWNRYPGVGCDTEASIYLPLLEDIGTMPQDRYARGPDIWAHAQDIAKHFDLYEHALLQTTVTSMTWVDEVDKWQLTTDRGDDMLARFVILANGSLQRLQLPAIPGLETFKGASFHTSRWDFNFTGGDALTDPTKLGDKVVGVVGTGATAVQCVPPLGRSAKDVFVFQRTPSAVAARNHGPVDPDWVSSLKPGWQDERRRNFSKVLYGGDVDEDLVNDGWTEIFRALQSDPAYAEMTPEDAAAAREAADLAQMEKVRQRIEAIVEDKETAEALKPWYAYWCKRPLFHDEYLQSFNRPNVHLVDTQGKGIERITEHGAIVDGHEYKLDCLVFATGFEGGTAYTRRIGFDVIGRDSLRLSEKWEGGFKTFHGIMTAGFPNMFFQATPSGQNTVTINFPDMMHENAKQMCHIIEEVLRRGVDTFEATKQAEEAWVETIIERAPDNRAFLESCTPGRFNSYGTADVRPVGNVDYGGGPLAFFDLLEEWRESGRYEGIQFGGNGSES